jgi:hypothetical protein
MFAGLNNGIISLIPVYETQLNGGENENGVTHLKSRKACDTQMIYSILAT